MKKILFFILSVSLILFACEKDPITEPVSKYRIVDIINDTFDTLFIQIKLAPIDTFVIVDNDTLSTIVYGSDSLIIPYYEPGEYTIGDFEYEMIFPSKITKYELSPDKSYYLRIIRGDKMHMYRMKKNDNENLLIRGMFLSS